MRGRGAAGSVLPCAPTSGCVSVTPHRHRPPAGTALSVSLTLYVNRKMICNSCNSSLFFKNVVYCRNRVQKIIISSDYYSPQLQESLCFASGPYCSSLYVLYQNACTYNWEILVLHMQQLRKTKKTQATNTNTPHDTDFYSLRVSGSRSSLKLNTTGPKHSISSSVKHGPSPSVLRDPSRRLKDNFRGI